ncbi:MAG TPA: DUF535 family protein [Terracidiphilus sp.]|jgi:uncharacterized protein VirK/YbjX
MSRSTQLRLAIEQPANERTNEGSIREVCGALLQPVTVLGGQLQWRSRLLAGILSRATLSHTTRQKIAELFEDPVLAEAVCNHPRLPRKYLAHQYLIRGLPIPVRAACLFHHYERLRSTLPVWLLRQTLLEEITLLDFHEGGLHFAVTMCISGFYDTEGELCLNLVMEGQIIYVIGFSIVPGWVANVPAKDILLIARIQGAKGFLQELSRAARTLRHVGPTQLLMAAVEGMASAFGIEWMASVSSTQQIAYEEKYAESFRRSYDDFFHQHGIPVSESGLFVTPLPLREKSLGEIKRGHKIRTREKRAFRLEIQNACADFFAKNGIPAA